MPRSRAQLEKKFDELYARAQAVLKQYDPCDVKDGQCYSMRRHPEMHQDEPFCCTGCPHLGPQGCTVESLFCRVWTCDPLDQKNTRVRGGKKTLSPMLKEMRRIHRSAIRWGFWIWRGTREESLQKALKKGL